MTLYPTIWSKNAILSEKQGGKNGFFPNNEGVTLNFDQTKWSKRWNRDFQLNSEKTFKLNVR